MPITTRPHPERRDLRFISWMELAMAGLSLRWHELGTSVVVRLMDRQDNRAWWGITLDGHWLRGSRGAITVFDSLPAAGRFLSLLRIHHFNMGEYGEHGPSVAGHPQEVYTLGDRCGNCQRGACDASPGQEIFPCPQLSQQRQARAHHPDRTPPTWQCDRAGSASVTVRR